MKPTPTTTARSLTLLTAALASLVLATSCTGEPDRAPDADRPSSASSGTASPSADPERETGLDAKAVLSPIALTPLAAAVPVVASDGRRHYAYELSVINQSAGTATLTSVQAETPDRADIGEDLAGDRLAGLFRVNGASSDGPTLEPGASGMLFMDVSADAGDPVPAQIEHTVELSFTPAGDGQEAAKAQRLQLTGVPVRVDQTAPVVVASPLRGQRWVVGNGCCSPINAHRGSTLSINGTATVAQRYAIDFVQLTDDNQAVTGDPKKNESFPAFGRTVYAAAAGTVVIRRDGEQEQTPGSLPAGATIQSADGNYLVIDIGEGRYAFYAHLQPGSLKPKVGDRVEVGDELGRLGNTGNTDAPHLHFHIMDGPSPLRSNGLPFVLDTFTGQGFLPDVDSVAYPKRGVVIEVDTSTRAGAHTEQMPLGGDLIAFPDR